MVENKFNFYNSYNFYYKSINRSIFFLDSNLRIIFDDFSTFFPKNKYFENYFGSFELIRKNKIKLQIHILKNTIFFRRKPPIYKKIRYKKIYNSFFKKYNIIGMLTH